MPINTANATWLSGDDDDDDVEPRLCDCPKFVPWHRGPAEYNLTTTNLLLPSHFEGVWGIPPAAGGKQDLSNSHYKPLGLMSKKSKWFSVVPRGLAGIHPFFLLRPTAAFVGLETLPNRCHGRDSSAVRLRGMHEAGSAGWRGPDC